MSEKTIGCISRNSEFLTVLQIYDTEELLDNLEQSSSLWKRFDSGDRGVLQLLFYGPTKRERIVMDALGGDLLVRKRKWEHFNTR